MDFYQDLTRNNILKKKILKSGCLHGEELGSMQEGLCVDLWGKPNQILIIILYVIATHP